MSEANNLNPISRLNFWRNSDESVTLLGGIYEKEKSGL
jgi:hypothetical protein